MRASLPWWWPSWLAFCSTLPPCHGSAQEGAPPTGYVCVVISSPVAPVPALAPYDGVLLVSFGGPEGHDEVMPFLERVTAGRGIPAERLEEVASHYHRRGGISPITLVNAWTDVSSMPAIDPEAAAWSPFLSDSATATHHPSSPTRSRNSSLPATSACSPC